jgi:hypothetical protein
VEYTNVSQRIGAVISSGHARMTELDSALGIEDLYNLLEIIQIDAHNQRIASKAAQGRRQ